MRPHPLLQPGGSCCNVQKNNKTTTTLRVYSCAEYMCKQTNTPTTPTPTPTPHPVSLQQQTRSSSFRSLSLLFAPLSGISAPAHSVTALCTSINMATIPATTTAAQQTTAAATVNLPSLSTLTAGETQLEYLCRNTKACVLRPYCFFVSWQGVLTLAYRGFPQSLVDLKQQVTDFYGGLPRESPGSKWPKTS